MKRFYGIGGGTSIAGIQDGAHTAKQYQQSLVDAQRQREAEDENLRRAKILNQHELNAEERRGESHGLDVEGKKISNRGGELTNTSRGIANREATSANAHSDKVRAEDSRTLGIRADAAISNAENTIDRNESESRLRPIKEATERSNAYTQQDSNRLAQLVNQAQRNTLPAKEQEEFNDLAIREQKAVFNTSKVSPEEAARMINDSAIMDVDDAATIKIEDGKWKAYTDQCTVAINKRTGKPVEWNLSELENAFSDTKGKGKGSGSGSGSGKAPKDNRIANAKAIHELAVSSFGYEHERDMSADERFELGNVKTVAENLIDDRSIGHNEAINIAKDHRRKRIKYGITMEALRDKAKELGGVDLGEALDKMLEERQIADRVMTEEEAAAGTPAQSSAPPIPVPPQDQSQPVEPPIAPALPTQRGPQRGQSARQQLYR